MKLSELEKGTGLCLSVVWKEQRYEFETRILGKKRREIILEPIRKDGRLLNVEGKEFVTDLFLWRSGDKPICWKNAGLHCILWKKQVVYAVSADSVGKTYNRRNFFRLFVGEEAVARVGERRARRVVLKDISNSGFAIISQREVPDGALIAMNYPVELEGKERKLMLYGKVRRTESLPDGRVMYGCSLVRKNELVGRYVTQKQMEKLVRKRQGLFDDEPADKEAFLASIKLRPEENEEQEDIREWKTDGRNGIFSEEEKETE